MADPDPMTCDPGSRDYDPDPGTVITDLIYLFTILGGSKFSALVSLIPYLGEIIFRASGWTATSAKKPQRGSKQIRGS